MILFCPPSVPVAWVCELAKTAVQVLGKGEIEYVGYSYGLTPDYQFVMRTLMFLLLRTRGLVRHA